MKKILIIGLALITMFMSVGCSKKMTEDDYTEIMINHVKEVVRKHQDYYNLTFIAPQSIDDYLDLRYDYDDDSCTISGYFLLRSNDGQNRRLNAQFTCVVNNNGDAKVTQLLYLSDIYKDRLAKYKQDTGKDLD